MADAQRRGTPSQADVGAIDSNHIQGGADNQNAMDNGQAQYVGDKCRRQPGESSVGERHRPRPDQDP